MVSPLRESLLHAMPLATGGKVVAPVQGSPPELDVLERTPCSVELSLWRRL